MRISNRKKPTFKLITALLIVAGALVGCSPTHQSALEPQSSTVHPTDIAQTTEAQPTTVATQMNTNTSDPDRTSSDEPMTYLTKPYPAEQRTALPSVVHQSDLSKVVLKAINLDEKQSPSFTLEMTNYYEEAIYATAAVTSVNHIMLDIDNGVSVEPGQTKCWPVTLDSATLQAYRIDEIGAVSFCIITSKPETCLLYEVSNFFEVYTGRPYQTHLPSPSIQSYQDGELIFSFYEQPIVKDNHLVCHFIVENTADQAIDLAANRVTIDGRVYDANTSAIVSAHAASYSCMSVWLPELPDQPLARMTYQFYRDVFDPLHWEDDKLGTPLAPFDVMFSE